MFYHLFRQTYLIVKRRMDAGDTARISKEILPEGITKTTYTYSNDGDELHQAGITYLHSLIERLTAVPSMNR